MSNYDDINTGRQAGGYGNDSLSGGYGSSDRTGTYGDSTTSGYDNSGYGNDSYGERKGGVGASHATGHSKVPHGLQKAVPTKVEEALPDRLHDTSGRTGYGDDYSSSRTEGGLGGDSYGTTGDNYSSGRTGGYGNSTNDRDNYSSGTTGGLGRDNYGSSTTGGYGNDNYGSSTTGGYGNDTYGDRSVGQSHATGDSKVPHGLQKAVPRGAEEALPNRIHDTSAGGRDTYGSGPDDYSTGTAGGAYGSTGPTDSLEREGTHGHSSYGGHNPREGTSEYGSGTAGGVGFGNKTSGGDSRYENDDTRFGTGSTTDAYSGSTEYGSGATGGAGFGNKSASHGTSSEHNKKHDSTMGKLMEKAGGMMHNEGMVEKGRAKREGAGANVDTTY